MKQTHLNLCFPEWQGYAVNNSVKAGALEIKNSLKELTFEEIEVPDYEQLPTENQIMGFNANLRQLKAVREKLDSIKPETTFMVAGTCASEIAPVSYLNKLYKGNLAVLWFDAHGDLNTPESSPSKHFHGMPLRTLLGESDDHILSNSFSVLQPSQVYILGGREFDVPEQDFIREKSIQHFSPEQLNETQSLINSIKENGFENLYIHIDLDVLEPTDFPHMLLPIPEGVMVEKLLKTLGALISSFNLVGSSIVEYVPKNNGDLKTVRKLVSTLGHV